MEYRIIMKEKAFSSKVLEILVGLFLFSLGVPLAALAMEVTLQWDANREPDLLGYAIYYKTGHSGGGVKENYTKCIRLTVDQDEYKDIPNLIVQYTVQGLEDGQNYVFVVTAFDNEAPSNESGVSNEVSTDDVPPGTVTNLTSSHPIRECVHAQAGTMRWSPAVDPEPGSGLAGYSYLLDAYPDTIPDEALDADAEATSVRWTLDEGSYWFHIRAADALGRSGTMHWGETVHYGPICVGTSPPTVVGRPEFLGTHVLVTYSKSNMQNADSAAGYVFSGGLGLLGYAVDINGTQKTFLLPMTNSQPFTIYRMTITDAVTDAMGNPLSGERIFTLNDDDGDGMADDWEINYFGSTEVSSGSGDTDEDGLADAYEYLYARQNKSLWGPAWWTLNPTNPDSDGDGIPDRDEVVMGQDPTSALDGLPEVDNGGGPHSPAVGYWPFDEDSGTTAFDRSGRGNDARIYGATWTAAGKVGGAMSFDGGISRLEIPYSAALGFATNKMTLACWIYPTNLAGDWVTIMQRTRAEVSWYDWQLYARAADAPTASRPVFRIDWDGDWDVDTNEEVQGNNVLSTNTWYHIAATYDGAKMRIYVDGVLAETKVVRGAIPNGGGDIWIGGNEVWGEYFEGLIDEVHIYDRALSATEINALMSNVSFEPIPVADLLGLSQANAESALIAVGFRVGITTDEFSDTIPVGTVIRQDPVGGTLSPAGSTVNLVVSIGPAPIPSEEAPNLTSFKVNGEAGSTVVYVNDVNGRIDIRIEAVANTLVSEYLILDGKGDPSSKEFRPIPGGPLQNPAFTVSDFALSAAEGTHTIYAWVKDDRGSVSAAATKTNIILDRTPPMVLLSCDGPNSYKAGDTVTLIADFIESSPISGLPTIRIEFVGTGGNVSDAEMTQVNDTRWAYTLTVPAGNDGKATVSVAAFDAAGNRLESHKTSLFAVDNTYPTIVGFPEVNYTEFSLTVAYSESNMKNADLATNYSFSNGLLLSGDGVDISGTKKVFNFPIEPDTLQHNTIYTMWLDVGVTDRVGNGVTPNAIRVNDNDKDGMPDDWERMWFGDVTSKDGLADTDGDGILDLDEYGYARGNPQWGADRWSLSPIDRDSDDDGIPDGYELQNGLNPTDSSDRDLDLNGNGVSNYDEYFYGLLAPVVNPIPDDWAVDWITYTGPIPSLFDGSQSVTWSLISGPPGMEIDHILGVVSWPEPVLDESPYTITIRAENLAGFNEQSFLLTVVPYHLTAYVNGSSGDDGTGDGSPERPWKSVGFALTKTQASLSPSVTIRVSAGRYDGNIAIPRNGIKMEGGWNSGFRQRWDFIRSGVEPSSEYETLIAGQSTGSVIAASSNTTIDGFTITGGKGINGGGISGGDVITVSNCMITGNSADMGGGIYIDAAAVVRNCLFLNNTARVGGGICTTEGAQVILSCMFKGNSADTGGGIFNVNSTPYIENCLFVGNTALGARLGHSGGGIGNESSYPYIVNCTFSGNNSGEYGGAIGNFTGSILFMTNSISWGNEAGVSGDEIYNDPGSETYVSYCDIQGSGGSEGSWDDRIGVDQGENIDADPLFLDPQNQNYHLQYLSPCVDAGDPASDYSREPEPNGGRVNLGAYGGTHQATMTPRPVITGQVTLTMLEDTALTVQLSDLTVTDPDNPYPTGFSLEVLSGNNYTRSGNTVIPTRNFSGLLRVPVRVNDGTLNSDVFNLSVTVTAVNDSPVITGQSALSTLEDTALRIQLSDLTVTDPDNPYPTGFSLKVLSGNNYTRSGNTVIPTRNFSGLLRVPVRVNDGTLNSDVFNLSVTVTAVNDSPVITGQSALSTLEDTAVTITPSDLTVNDPDNTYPHGFTLTVLPGANYSTVGNTITPSLNFTGTLTVPVTINDGTADSALFGVIVEVLRDLDGDGVPDIQDPDDDNDGMPDDWELANGHDPKVNDAGADPDHDGLSNLEEYYAGTNPWMTDSDGDGIGDGTEVAMGTDPLNQADTPRILLATDGLRITDVTTKAFSLVWVANQAASCFVNVYSDPEGKDLIDGITITDESANHPPAAQNGVMKVRVSGLAPDTTYYFRIVTTSDEGILVEPGSGPLPSVQTEASSVLVVNDVIQHRILMGDGSNPAIGSLLVVEVEGGDYPVTGWVGDGILAPRVFVDLSNVYSAASHRSLELFGGEAITLESIGGLMGFRRLAATVPEETGGIQILSPEPDDEQCTLDNAGPVIDGGQLLPGPGAVINDGIPLISGAYSDELSEIDHSSARLEVDGLDVTGQAVVDSAGIWYTPLVPLAEGVHSVVLVVADEWGYEAVPVTWSFTIDLTWPAAMFTYSTMAPTNQDVVVTLVPSEPVTVTNNGGQGTYTFTENGSFTFEFVDVAGNTGSTTVTASNIDRVPPQVTGLSDDPGPLKGKTWNWSADEAATFRYLIDQNPLWALPDGEFTGTTSASQFAENGLWYLHVQARDAAGNVSAVRTVSVLLDNTAPVVTIARPVNGDYLYPAQQTVQWNVDDADLSGVVLALNSIPVALSADAVDATITLGPGINMIEVSAADQLGNIGVATIYVRLDLDHDGDGVPDIQDPDDDNDGMPDDWELEHGLNPLNPFDAAQDRDGDRHSNLSEYTAGTDPQDSENYPLMTFLVEHITVTDVTPNGFCVIWQSSEPATCSLAVYDEIGSPLNDIEIVSESALHAPAEDIGVMKVRVNGLEPGKVYFFQTLTISKLDGFAKFAPYPEVREVVTESSITAVNNDLFKQRIYDEEGYAADGALLLGFVTGGHYPVSGWVGQSFESPWASLDLNEVYSEISHQNLQLAGGEELTLWSFGGQLGHYVNVQEIPVPSGVAEAALVDYSLLDREVNP